MKTLLRLALATALLVGCGEKFPEKYQEYDFTREGMFTAFDDEKGMTALYDEKQDTDALIADWDKKLSAKGFKKTCEKLFDDKSVLRGYVGSSKRFLFSGGKLGQQSELHLTVVPDHVKDDEMCPEDAKKK